MATQGMVTIKKNGRVVMKIVAGDNGNKARALADSIRVHGEVPVAQVAYAAAQLYRFGSVEDLVVIDETSIVYMGRDQVDDLYRQTFNDPNYNPRWPYTNGACEHLEIVEL